MAKTVTPESQQELAEIIAAATSPFSVQGLGTKPIGHGLDGDVLSLKNFSGIVVYEPEELILEAKAATSLAELEKLVGEKGQMLAFEPPDYSRLFGAKSSGTLGGAMACGLSGPRRLKAGAARDHILGVSGITGQGLAFKAGARVVKNVTGYDMPKLLCSSHGTLAVMTSIIVKVLPRPETEETLVFTGLGDHDAIALLAGALQTSAEISSAAHVPGEGTYLRLEGIAPSVAYRRDRLLSHLKKDGNVLDDKQSRKLWKALRDVEPFWSLRSHAIWRISTTPGIAADVMQKIAAQLTTRHYYDWAGGLIWLAVADAEDGGAGVIRAAIPSGHATLLKASELVKAKVPVFQPQPPALAALTARVKQAFDPRGILNPGRMYKGI